MIVLAHYRYRKQEPTKSKFPMPLYPISTYVIFAFLLFVVFVLFLQKETRQALYLMPFWFIALYGLSIWQTNKQTK